MAVNHVLHMFNAALHTRNRMEKCYYQKEIKETSLQNKDIMEDLSKPLKRERNLSDSL